MANMLGKVLGSVDKVKKKKTKLKQKLADKLGLDKLPTGPKIQPDTGRLRTGNITRLQRRRGR